MKIGQEKKKGTMNGQLNQIVCIKPRKKYRGSIESENEEIN